MMMMTTLVNQTNSSTIEIIANLFVNK